MIHCAPMRIFVLGVGATGSLLIKLLIRHGHQVSCGDRDPIRARAFLGEKPVFPIHRVNARHVFDIARAAKGCHLLINTCPAVFNKIVLRAALRLRVHYLDTASHLRHHPFRPEQVDFDEHFRRKRRTALIDAGAAPGLTNVLAMYAGNAFQTLDRIQIRLFEGTSSDSPVSQWSPDSSFDEAVSRPRLYRNGHFQFGKKFGDREMFRFLPPIGRVAVMLAAQDEVVTLPNALRLNEMDAKIGGPDMDRLRRWYKQGKLRRSRGIAAARFPATPTPRLISRLVRGGLLRNARFAGAVLIRGRMHGRQMLVRWDATFPSLVDLRRRGLSCSPIAWANAQLASIFVKHFPRQRTGVVTPESLPATVLKGILRDVRSRGIRLTKKAIPQKMSDEMDTI